VVGPSIQMAEKAREWLRSLISLLVQNREVRILRNGTLIEE
jgi:hypothetical protein